MSHINRKEKLRELADSNCICTPDQQSGIDVTVCKSCMAGEVLNDVSFYETHEVWVAYMELIGE